MMISANALLLFVNDCRAYLNDEDVDIIASFLNHIDNNHESADKYFNRYLKEAKISLSDDLKFFFDSDPAANSLEEIVLAYPGYLAITYYRIAHPLYLLNYKSEARFISEQAHRLTSIDIHPGAVIDVPFFIDHGTGIVIGETAVVGKRVKIYQGVTLGAISLARGQQLKGMKRHPTIEDGVTIYSGASILGDIVVGEDVTLGSNTFIIKDVPPRMKVYIGEPSLVFEKKK